MANFKKEVHFAIAALSLTLVMLMAVSVSSYFWRSRQLEAECYPVKVRDAYPMLSFMPSVNTQFNTAKFYNFIVKYVELTKNKNLEQFKRGLTEKTRSVATSEALLSAVTYATGEEKKRVMMEFYKSQDSFSELKRSGLSWRFNIEGIEYVHSLPSGKVFVVSLIGEYQVDSSFKDARVDTSDLWGYRRLVYKIVQEAPTQDTKGRWFNQDGLFVLDSYEETITQLEYDELIDRQFNIEFPVE